MEHKRKMGALIAKARYWGARLRTRKRFQYKGYRFEVRPDVLNPTAFRASFVFADQALFWAPRQPCRVLELGCGSGFVSVLLSAAGHQTWAVDLDPEAIANTQDNAIRNKQTLSCLLSDWDQAIDPELRFDYIVSNPPFLANEPHMLSRALYAGPGLNVTGAMLTALARRLAPGGQALVMTSSFTGREAFLALCGEKGLALLQSKPHTHWNETIYLDRLVVQ